MKHSLSLSFLLAASLVMPSFVFSQGGGQTPTERTSDLEGGDNQLQVVPVAVPGDHPTATDTESGLVDASVKACATGATCPGHELIQQAAVGSRTGITAGGALTLGKDKSTSGDSSDKKQNWLMGEDRKLGHPNPAEQKVTVPAGLPESQPAVAVGPDGETKDGTVDWNEETALAGLPQHVQTAARSGDRDGALAAAKAALAQNPDDKNLRAFVELAKPAEKSKMTEKTISDRAKELLAGLRGDAGDAPPPGAAIAASGVAFPGLSPAGAAAGPGLNPAALAAALGGKARLASPLVRDASTKLAMRDYPAAKDLLDKRIAEASDDEPAFRLRAFALRQMRRFSPSADDARSALRLDGRDSRARRVLVDDLVDLGRSQEALEVANLSLQQNPRDAQVLAARANVWASLGERDKQLADLKEAAALDSQFDQLYEQSLLGAASPARHPRSYVVWLGAIGTALLFFSFVLFRKRGDSSVRLAMRAEDHAVLARGGRPDAPPAGFQIVRTLGQGGMGVVYEAVDLGLQRTVALKKLRSEIADNPRERARFLKEARTVAALKHPNIVAIHAIHEDAEGLFLVFEKVPGETLHDLLANGPLPPREAVSWLRQVASALDYAHGQGVVHQDLKPANVMVAGGSAKVMDFGIARRVAETMSTLSRVEVAGTPAYMAPEQEMGGAVGPTADVFALGACAYELLTGRAPFPNGGAMMKAQKMYRPLTEARPGLGAAADAALARALEPEPAKRWPSASSFVEALARSFAVPA